MPKYMSIIPMILFGVIFIIGLVNAINPRFAWKTLESWKATKEPSKAFFLVRRIIGIAVMVIIIALVVFPYLMNK